MSKIWIATGVILFPSLAAAHLEHAAGEDFGLVHYLLDPAHVALMGAAVLFFLTVRGFARGHRSIDRAEQ